MLALILAIVISFTVYCLKSSFLQGLLHSQSGLKKVFDILMNLKFVKPSISQAGFADSRALEVSTTHRNERLFAKCKRTIIKTKRHCLNTSAILFSLLIAIGLFVPPAGKTEVVSYDHPITNPLAATVVGTPQSYQADLPKKIPVKEWELEVFTDREIPDILWYNRTLRYSFVAQEDPAPLIFVIAGTKGLRLSRRNPAT